MITAVNDGDSSIRLFYSATGFQDGLTVTGYVIYLNLQNSPIYTFVALGDGIYTVSIPVVKTNKSASERCGIVIKENGVAKTFEILLVVH